MNQLIKEGILYPLIFCFSIILPSAIHYYFTNHPIAFAIGFVGICGLLLSLIFAIMPTITDIVNDKRKVKEIE